MKSITFFLFLISYVSLGQNIKRLDEDRQTSIVDLKGNNNIIRVIQGEKVIVYDLKDEKKSQEFLAYLKTIPALNKNTMKLLNNSKKTLEIVRKIDEDGVFNTSKFIEKIEDYVKQIEQLKLENAKLKIQTTDGDFSKTLEKLVKALENYDNEGYQQLLEEYKVTKKDKIQQDQREISAASYLQAKNNFSNYNFEKALEQLNEALEFDKGNERYLFLKGKTLFSLLFTKESIDTYYHLLDITNNDTLRFNIYNDLGIIYNDQSNYDKSIEYFNKALVIQKKIFGKDNFFEAVSYTNIGSVYIYKDDYDEALEYFTESLRIQESLINIDSIGIANTYNNIGIVYKYKSDYEKALEYYNRSLRILEKVLGKYDLEIAATYSNIGIIYKLKGDYDKAFDYSEKALMIKEKILGKESPKTAISYTNIGSIYYAKADYNKAMEYYRKGLIIKEKTFNKLNRSTATSYENIGSVYLAKKNYDSALEYYGKALDIFEKIFGMPHQATFDTYVNMGTISIVNGEKEKGLSYLKKIPFAPYKMESLLNETGEECFSKNNYQQSIDLYTFAIELLEKSDTAKINSLWVTLYNNIAMAYCANGNQDQAILSFEKAIASFQNFKDKGIDIEVIKKNYENCKAK